MLSGCAEIPWCLQSRKASLVFLAETVFLGRMIRQQHTPRMLLITSHKTGITGAHPVLHTGWLARKLCWAVITPQADCHIPWACVSHYPHQTHFTKLTFKKIWVAKSQQDPTNNLCRSFSLSCCGKVKSTSAHDLCSTQRQWKARRSRGIR